MHEAQMHEDNCVITLTYDDENIPNGETLIKSHFQKFMKRLRKSISPLKIRFYHCGEYGDPDEQLPIPRVEKRIGRPHYHAVIFGYQFNDLQIHEQKATGDIYTSEFLSQIWGKGFVTIMELNLSTAGYVARYITKKINGDLKDDYYIRTNQTTGEIQTIQQEYSTMSNKPGIAKAWWDKYKDDIFPSDDCIVLSKNSYHHVPTPKYYDTQLEKEDPKLYEKIKQQRKDFAMDHISDSTLKRLLSREVCKTAQTNLKRKLNT